jgi:hypothetical protein
MHFDSFLAFKVAGAIGAIAVSLADLAFDRQRKTI